MKQKKQKVYLLPLFIDVIREMALTAIKIIATATVIWYVISGIVNSLPALK